MNLFIERKLTYLFEENKNRYSLQPSQAFKNVTILVTSMRNTIGWSFKNSKFFNALACNLKKIFIEVAMKSLTNFFGNFINIYKVEILCCSNFFIHFRGKRSLHSNFFKLFLSLIP